MPVAPTEHELKRALAIQLVRFRSDRGLSQEELAAKLGISPRQLQNLEKGGPKTSFVLFLTLLGLMKDEVGAALVHEMRKKLRELQGVEPLRRPDTKV